MEKKRFHYFLKDQIHPYRIGLFLFVIAFILRFLYIQINLAETTDGYMILRLVENISRYRKESLFYNDNPIYPLLIKGFSIFSPKSTLLLARFISILAGAGSTVVLFLITYKIFQQKLIAFLAGLFLAVQPIHLFWSIRVVPDSSFIFFLLLALFFLIDKKQIRSTLLCAIATLTKMEGIFFLPLILFFDLTKKVLFKKLGLILIYGSIVVPWLLTKYGAYSNFRTGFQSITKLMHKSILFKSLGKIIFTHLSLFPYVFTLGIVIFMAWGIVLYFKELLQSKDIKGYLVIAYVAIYLALILVWPYFQLRHWLPFIPLVLIWAALGVIKVSELISSIVTKYTTRFNYQKLKMTLAFTIATVLCLNSFQIATKRIFDLREVFGDIKKASLWLSQNAKKDDIILTNVPDKLQYYSPELNILRINSKRLSSFVTQADKDIYVVVANYRKIKTILPCRIKKVVSFDSRFKFSYPFAPWLPYSSRRSWIFHKDKYITQTTQIYILPKIVLGKPIAISNIGIVGDSYLEHENLLKAEGFKVAGIAKDNFTYQEIQDYDLIIFDDGPNYDLSAKEVEALEEYYDAGGNIILASDDLHEAPPDVKRKLEKIFHVKDFFNKDWNLPTKNIDPQFSTGIEKLPDIGDRENEAIILKDAKPLIKDADGDTICSYYEDNIRKTVCIGEKLTLDGNRKRVRYHILESSNPKWQQLYINIILWMSK